MFKLSGAIALDYEAVTLIHNTHNYDDNEHDAGNGNAMMKTTVL